MLYITQSEKGTKHMLLRPRFMATQYLMLLQYNYIVMEVLHKRKSLRKLRFSPFGRIH